MPEQSLVVLLLKLAVAASAASILIRFEAFQRALWREERTISQQLRLAFALAAVFGACVGTRVLTGTYQAADLGLEGSFLAGLVGGYVPGLAGGVLISIPAMLNGELLSMPLFATVGVLGGLLRDGAPDQEEIWRLSPFPDRNLYRAIRRRDEPRHLAFQLLFLILLFVIEGFRYTVASYLSNGRGLFTLYPNWPMPNALTYGAILLTTMLSVVLPLKIWANARTERKLEQQALTLQQARLRALMSQINPHFLFNTLNSIASLIRTNPDSARQLILRLSNILRRQMRKSEAMTTLRDELSFIDDYLSIEQVRFGPKLRFTKEIGEDALDTPVPSMLLQPIVENSLKHGLSNRVQGGGIWLRARVEENMLHLEIEDDGEGIPEPKLAQLFEQGIGISNVNERLQVLYGADYRIWVDSRPGEGTRTGIEIPSRPKMPAAAS